MIDSLVTIALLITVGYITKYYYDYFTRENPLPGPFPFPLIGNSLQLGIDMAKSAKKCQKEYGDMWETYIGSIRIIWLGRSDLIEKLYSPSTKNAFFHRSDPVPVNGEIETSLYSTGITFNRDVDLWRHNRKVLEPIINSSDFVKECVSVTGEFFQEAQTYWKELGEDPVLNFSIWIRRLMGDILFVMFTSKRTHVMGNYFNLSDAKKGSYPSALKKTGTEEFILGMRVQFNMNAFFSLFPPIIRHNLPMFSKYNKKLYDNYDLMNDELGMIIRERKKEVENTPIDQPLKPDLLTSLLTINTERGTKIVKDDGYTRPMNEDEIIKFMHETLPGVDSIAEFICFLTWHAIKYPKAKERLLEEIQEVFGDDLNRKITYEDLHKLRYLDAFVNEVLRVMMVTPIAARQSPNEEEIGGYKWKPLTIFYSHMQGISKHPSYWKDPEVFNPDRFYSTSVKRINFMPFGGGVRICPGKHMSVVIAKTILLNLLRNYTMEFINKDTPLETYFLFINYSIDLKVHLKPKVK